MATDPPTGFATGLERNQAILDAGGLLNIDDPSMVDTRVPHAAGGLAHVVGGVGSAETYGLAGVGEASQYNHPTHPARFSAHAKPLGDEPTNESHEPHAAGAASFEGQKMCQCSANGKCTCTTCKCENCAAEHTEAQLRGKQQPEHPRPAVTGV